MAERNTGGPAFPSPEQRRPDGEVVAYVETGMTLRDYFAAKAMPGLLDVCRDDDHPGVSYLRHIAQLAYRMADEMLEVRND